MRTHPFQSYHLQCDWLSLVVVAHPAVDHAAETSSNYVVEVEAKGADPLLGMLGRGRLGKLLAVAFMEGGVSFRTGGLWDVLGHEDKFSFH
jgi:hypothetical protein